MLDARNETPLDIVKKVITSDHSDSNDDSRDESRWEKFTDFVAHVIGKEDVTEQDHLKKTKIIKLLQSVNAMTSEKLQEHLAMSPSKECMKPFSDILHQATAEGSHVPKRLNELLCEIKEIVRSSEQKKRSSQEAMVLMSRMLELQDYKRAGSRILVLDGGGMKGLLQIEILRNIEESTGRRITEIFDWIVGTSIGGILALALVHGRLVKSASIHTYHYSTRFHMHFIL